MHTKLDIYVFISRIVQWVGARVFNATFQGRIQDFKLGGRTSKNCAERREARKFLGYFVWKITILRKKIVFFSNFRGACAPGAPPPPPLGSAPAFNNISVISWQSLLLMEETGVPGENHRPTASHWQTLNYHIMFSGWSSLNVIYKLLTYQTP